jgi:regulator of replication initiation timing
MSFSFNKIWKQFILEGKNPDISVWLQSLKDNLDLLKPRSVREGKRVSVMKHQINEISKATNRLIKENHMLQEENKLLQETKDDQKETK